MAVMVQAIERCSGHNVTYAVKKEFRDAAVKIARPVAPKVDDNPSSRMASDCPMAAIHIADAAQRDVLPDRI